MAALPRYSASVAVVVASGVAADFAIRKHLERRGLDSSCTMVDVIVCKSKGLLEGKHFLQGLGHRIEAGMAAISRMKRTSPTPVTMEWCTAWQQRTSKLTDQRLWLRRGTFESPVSELLHEDARRATVWELRGSEPSDGVGSGVGHGRSSEAYKPTCESVGDLLLPSDSVWLGVRPIDSGVDAAVRWLNKLEGEASSQQVSGNGSAIVILPDFGGEFCKRTLPLGELVASQQPEASIFLLEMPLRGTRKPLGYHGAVMPAVHDMMFMGCAIIEECRSLLSWAQASGYEHLTLSGMSMGAHMAALVACCLRLPGLRLCLLMPSHSAEANWTDGGIMGMNRGMSADELRPYLREATAIDAYPTCCAERAVIVAARDDGYVPLWSAERLRDSLRSQGVPVEFQIVEGGHVTGFLARQADFAKALVSTACRQR